VPVQGGNFSRGQWMSKADPKAKGP
jgi:hypothetical protein